MSVRFEIKKGLEIYDKSDKFIYSIYKDLSVLSDKDIAGKLKSFICDIEKRMSDKKPISRDDIVKYVIYYDIYVTGGKK